MDTSIKDLPALPGVYFFKNAQNTIIYIGKAKNLRKRVQSYFFKQKTDWKVAELLQEYTKISHIVTNSESDALLLEAQLIRDYKPKFNVLLKTGQPFIYLLFTAPSNRSNMSRSSNLQKLEIVRNKSKKGVYFGPFLTKQDARAVHSYLLRTFQLELCNKQLENGCLDYHIGRCAGICKQNFNQTDYLMRLELAKSALKDDRKAFLKHLEQTIADFNKQLEFEKAAHLSGYAKNFETIFTVLKEKYHAKKYAPQVESVTTPSEIVEQEVEQALADLQKLLKLDKKPQTIDCFDISHFQSTHIVGSCIRFTDGKKDQNNFRRFKVRSLEQQNDYAALQEIVLRRYRDRTELPDIIFIDGGKGQRNAITQFFPNTTCISLAKREELLISDAHPDGYKLDLKTPLGRLLISIRDYAHHFAISYHRLERNKKSNYL